MSAEVAVVSVMGAFRTGKSDSRSSIHGGDAVVRVRLKQIESW